MSESEEKKHTASNRKLRKQRDQGSIPNSQDSTGLFATAAGVAAVTALSVIFWQELTSALIANPETFVMPFDEAREVAITRMLQSMRMVIAPVLLIVLTVSILLTLVINKGVVLAMKPVQPDLKRVSLQSGFKRIFGKRGRMETTIASIRLVLWLAFTLAAAALWLPGIFGSIDCAILCQSNFAQTLLRYLVTGATIIMIIFAAIDILVQKQIFMNDQKMTETELKRERKDQSTSPEIRRERNRRRQEMDEGTASKVKMSDTTILFTSSRGVVGINYSPPNQKLPLISVKAKAGVGSKEVMQKIKQLGISVVESEAIVANTLGKGNGEMLDVAHFREFALAMASR